MAITVTGSDRLKRKFEKLGTVAQGRMLERALVAGALPIQNDAKRNAPYLSGNLRRSIHIGGHDDLAGDSGATVASSGAGVPPPEIGPTGAAVYVGTDVAYAAAAEFGYGNRAPHPYLRPAMDANRSIAVQEVRAVLLELIGEAT